MPDPTPLSASQFVLQARRFEIDAVRHLARRAELADIIGQLIQALQRERGASSLFLASSGQRFGEVRRSTIEQARPLEARLRGLFAAQLDAGQGATAGMLSLMAWVLLGLDSLDELRAQIDAQALSAHDSVAAYSRRIAGLIELVVQLADAALLPSISRLLVAFLHLVQAQEAAGQERALGALLFASGVSNDAQQERVVHLIDAQERYLKVFSEFAAADQRTAWEQQQLAPGVAQLERLRRTLCTARSGATLDSNLSDTWFDVSSVRIDQLWQLQVELMKRLRDECEARIRDAEQDLLDVEGLLRRVRDNPPAHTHAVDRFFDTEASPGAVPELVTAASGESASLLDVLQTQAARLASMELELGSARRALHERKVIERAKGVLMSRLRMNEEEAFRALQKTSMDQNRRLLEVAEATLSLPDFAFGPPSERPGS
jgi:hypothetical protein